MGMGVNTYKIVQTQFLISFSFTLCVCVFTRATVGPGYSKRAVTALHQTPSAAPIRSLHFSSCSHIPAPKVCDEVLEVNILKRNSNDLV